MELSCLEIVLRRSEDQLYIIRVVQSLTYKGHCLHLIFVKDLTINADMNFSLQFMSLGRRYRLCLEFMTVCIFNVDPAFVGILIQNAVLNVG